MKNNTEEEMEPTEKKRGRECEKNRKNDGLFDVPEQSLA
jgi:hypothetical protein